MTAPSIKEALGKLVRDTYNEGFNEGMNEVTRRVNGGKSWFDVQEKYEAKLAAALATLSQPTADRREIVARLRKLIATATLLYQNAVGCAANHHSVDFEQQGLPGWLADCERDIRAASASLDGGAGE